MLAPVRVLLALALAPWLAVPAPAVGGDEALLATLANERITESSGLAAGRRTPGVLWTVNDSGDGPFLYATDRTGQDLATFAVTGADNVDWEDLATGPGADGGDALYIADFGDNARSRDDLALYRVPEPALPPTLLAGGDPIPTAPAERLPFAYPDGHHDAEALLVHPLTGETLVVTKERSGPALVYRFPAAPRLDQPTILVPVAAIAFPGPVAPARAATGGAVAPDGTRVVIRTPLSAFEWRLESGESLAAALAREPHPLAIPLTPRGEAIAYRADGAALLLTSEESPCPLYEVPRP